MLKIRVVVAFLFFMLGVECQAQHSVTPVYVTICSHNETDDARYGGYDSLAGYLWFRDNMLQILQLVKNHNAKWDFQCDWRFLEAARNYESLPGVTDNTNGKNILRYLAEDNGVQIDPHSHESDGYNYADVAYLISTMGVEPTGIVGGFLYSPPENVNWEKFWNPLQGSKYPTYTWQTEALWGGGTFMHAGPDDSSYGVWRPKDKYNFTIDNPASHLACIGNGNESRATCLSDILRLIQALENGDAPAGKLYTASYMVFELEADQSYTQWDGALTSLDQYVASGKIVYATLNEVLNIWRTQYQSEGYRYVLGAKSTGLNNIAANGSIPLQNYPNPFNPTTTIQFSIQQREHVTLKIFDMLGRELATLVDGDLSAGEHSVRFSAEPLPSGVYFYRLTTPIFSQTKSMEIVK